MTKISKELKPPGRLTGACYSNFDNSFDDGAEERLRNGEVLQHAAWDFCGTVWFAANQFHDEVWQYQRRVKTISADTLSDVIKATNEEFGHN